MWLAYGFTGAMRWTDLLEQYRTTTNVIGTVVIAWILSAILGQAIGLVLPANEPLAAKRDPLTLSQNELFLGASFRNDLEDYLTICERNIFDSTKAGSCEKAESELAMIPVDEPEVDPNAAPVKSDLPVELVGTMVFGNRNKSFATIAKKSDRDPQNYYIGDTLLGEAKIYEIVRNKVFLVRNGRREYLEVPNLVSVNSVPSQTFSHQEEDRGIERKSDSELVVSRAKVESTLGDLNKVIREARMVPNFVGGKVDGFKIFAIKPGSIFQELGLKNGDVVQAINGTVIDSVEKALPMMQLARTADSIQLDLKRRGQKKSISIEIQ